MGTDERADHSGDVERYEQLRGRALAGDLGGWRGGLAVLQHRGVAAWLGAWRAVPAAPAAPGPARRDVLPPNGSTAVPPNGSGDGLVHALAGMALGALAGG